MAENESKLLFKKFYPREPDILLHMEYYRKKDSSKRIIKNWSEINGYNRDPEAGKGYEACLGVYCMKCGNFQEFTAEEAENIENTFRCKCGKKFYNSERRSSNVSAAERRSEQGLWSAIPHKLTITEKDNKIRIVATAKNWYLNPVSKTPYSRKFTLTVVINTVTGQSYIMSAINDGKPVFTLHDIVRNVCVTTPVGMIGEFDFVAYNFVDHDPEVKSVLGKILDDYIPGFRFSETDSLQAMVDMNYFRSLYDLYPAETRQCSYYRKVNIWRALRKRYHKKPETFPQYLFWGCSKVATKSIRKILYAKPEQKWTLYFLNRTLGIDNIDILRNILKSEESVITDMAQSLKFDIYYYSHDIKKEAQKVFDVIKNSDLPDSKKLNFLIPGKSIDLLSDTVKMLEICEMPAEEILKYEDIKKCHDDYIKLSMKVTNPDKWKAYSTPKKYDNRIENMEEINDYSEFKLIRVPFDLDSLQERFHNCVHSYKDKVSKDQAVIFEMLLNGKPAACIELIDSGKRCHQAYAACNEELQGEAKEEFNKWLKRHKIKFFGNPGHAFNQFVFHPGDDDDFMALPDEAVGYAGPLPF